MTVILMIDNDYTGKMDGEDDHFCIFASSTQNPASRAKFPSPTHCLWSGGMSSLPYHRYFIIFIIHQLINDPMYWSDIRCSWVKSQNFYSPELWHFSYIQAFPVVEVLTTIIWLQNFPSYRPIFTNICLCKLASNPLIDDIYQIANLDAGEVWAIVQEQVETHTA